MSAQDNSLNVQISQLHIGTQAASIVLPGMKMRKGSKLLKVSLINQVALAQSDTNYLIVKLLKNGVAIATISSKLTDGTGPLVANTPLAAPEANLDLLADDLLTVEVVKNGTGVPTLAALQLEWFPK